MRVYPAAVYTNGYMRGQDRYVNLNERERAITDSLPQVLESYHYVNKQRYVDAMRDNGAKILLDSGAYSAYTLGATISLDEYIGYIERNKDIIEQDADGAMYVIVLDSIRDPEGTRFNQHEMERRGVRPLPCFHQGEPEWYLEYYISRYEFITLGGMTNTSNRARMVWLDRLWEKYLTDGSGNPRCKVHGLGMTSLSLMARYPWYSVDSSSWIQATAFGSVMTWGHGSISVSEKSPNRKQAGAHISTFTPIEQEYLCNLWASQGFDIERLATVYESRAAYNLFTFTEFNKHIDAARAHERFVSPVQELF